jgi:diguanylate cyclase (GGDEF)-like protein
MVHAPSPECGEISGSDPEARGPHPLIPDFVTWQATRRELRVALTIAGIMVAVALLATTLGRAPRTAAPVVLPLLMGSVIITEWLSATVLLSQFIELGYPSLVFSASAYLLSGCFVIPYLLTFPGVFVPTGWFHANEQTALVLWAAWHTGFPLLVLVSAIVQHRCGRRIIPLDRARRVAAGAVVTCIAVAVCAAVVTTRLSPVLPTFVHNGLFTPLTQGVLLPFLCLIDLTTLAALALPRRRTIMTLWIGLAVLASLLDSVMGLVCQRYSLGWYAGKIFSVASSGLILGAFVYQFISLSRHLGAAQRDLARIAAMHEQQARERLQFLATHDALTGLTNRSRFRRIVREHVTSALQRGSLLAVLVIDIDRFRDINDAYGRQTGDLVLVEAARRLRAKARASEPVARTGIDQFAVLVTDLRTPADAEPAAARLRGLFRLPFLAQTHRLNVAASIGIALCPADGATPDALLEHAEAAVKHAKKGAAGQLYYNEDVATQIRTRRWVHEGLRRGLERNEFVLHFQPLVGMRNAHPIGAEALLRWRPPHGEAVSPAEFIPIAEETGLMIPLGRWVLENALRSLAAQPLGCEMTGVAVNVSARQLQDPMFFHHVRATLEKANVSPERLELEVTESVAIADAHGDEHLRRCRGLGVGVAIDDFGTHYSSLAYLKRLPVTTVKIDRSFICGLPDNREDAAIVAAIIQLIHTLGRRVIAEGVETAEQWHWLREAGCDVAQGYYVAHPMPREAWQQWAKARYTLPGGEPWAKQDSNL